jgi:hypothetical protein
MPCSQMIRMNIRPPRPSAASKLARLPAQKARIRNRVMLNIGWAARASTAQNAPSIAMPPAIPVITQGLVQPVVCPP